MGKDFPIYKVAAVQASPVYLNRPNYFDGEATLSKAVSAIEEAGKNGARLVVFPETFLPGYPYFSLSLQTNEEAAEFFHLWKEYLRNSPTVPGRETGRLGAAAKNAGCYVVMGINESDPDYEGRMYNSILYIGPDGEVMGTHRKLNITINELFFHTRGDVTRVNPCDNIKVYNSPLGRISGLICGEHYQPLLKQHLVVEGEQIHVGLWPGLSFVKTSMLVTTQALCISARCWAVVAACCITKDAVPENTYSNNSFHMSIGGSCVINPLGEIVAPPLYGTEGIVYHDVDLGLIPVAKARTNLTGIYDRRDVLGLVRREQPFRGAVPMEWLREGAPLQNDERIAALNERLTRLESKKVDEPRE